MPLIQGIEVHDDFICPITLLIMRDPVIDSNGDVSEREAIERRLADAGRGLDNLEMHDHTLTPAQRVRRRITALLEAHPILLEENEVYLPLSTLVAARNMVREQDLEALHALITEEAVDQAGHVIHRFSDYRMLTCSFSQRRDVFGANDHDPDTEHLDYSAYHMACEFGDWETAQFILNEVGIEKIVPTVTPATRPQGWNPAVLNRKLYDDARAGDVANLALYCELGADVNVPIAGTNPHNNETPIFAACRNHPDVVVELLRLGADPHIASGGRAYTPMHEASYHGHADIVLALLGFELDDDGERVPLGAGVGAPIVANFVGVNDPVKQNGMSALALAANRYKDRVVRVLLAMPGVDVDSKDVEGRTPVYHASAVYPHSELVLSMLVAAGGNLRELRGDRGVFSGAYGVHNKGTSFYEGSKCVEQLLGRQAAASVRAIRGAEVQVEGFENLTLENNPLIRQLMATVEALQATVQDLQAEVADLREERADLNEPGDADDEGAGAGPAMFGQPG